MHRSKPCPFSNDMIFPTRWHSGERIHACHEPAMKTASRIKTTGVRRRSKSSFGAQHVIR